MYYENIRKYMKMVASINWQKHNSLIFFIHGSHYSRYDIYFLKNIIKSENKNVGFILPF